MAAVKKEGLRWEKPPISGGDKHAHRPLADQLIAHPGEWAHILTYNRSSISSSVAGAIRRGTTNAWRPEGAFEAKARKVVVGRRTEYRVYARYVGVGHE